MYTRVSGIYKWLYQKFSRMATNKNTTRYQVPDMIYAYAYFNPTQMEHCCPRQHSCCEYLGTHGVSFNLQPKLLCSRKSASSELGEPSLAAVASESWRRREKLLPRAHASSADPLEKRHLDAYSITNTTVYRIIVISTHDEPKTMYPPYVHTPATPTTTKHHGSSSLLQVFPP